MSTMLTSGVLGSPGNQQTEDQALRSSLLPCTARNMATADQQQDSISLPAKLLKAANVGHVCAGEQRRKLDGVILAEWKKIYP